MTRLLAIAALLTACHGGVVVVSGIEVYEGIWANTLLQLGQTAAFDMQCPSEQLEFELLQRRARYPSQVGVTGCGQRVRYVREFATGNWIANTTNSANRVVAPSPQAAATPTAAPPTSFCQISPGDWTGPLRVDGVAVLQGGYAQDVVLTERSLRAHVRGAGWHVYGEADLGRDAILRASRTMWVGEGVAVATGGRVMVLAAEPGQVELGVAVTPDVTFVTPPRRWFPCAAIGLSTQELNMDSALDALQLPRGRPGHVSLLTIAHRPGGEPFVIQDSSPSGLAHSVRIIEERHGFTRVAGYLPGNGSHALLVGWAQAETLVDVISGLTNTSEDGTAARRCQIPSDLPLFVEAQGLAKQEVGRVERGTALMARPGDDGWWNVHPVVSDDALRIADGVTFSVRPNAPLQCGRSAQE